MFLPWRAQKPSIQMTVPKLQNAAARALPRPSMQIQKTFLVLSVDRDLLGLAVATAAAVCGGQGLLILVEHALVEGLVGRRHVVGGVVVAEVVRLEVHLRDLGGHDGEVLDAGDVVEAERVPDDNVLVDDGGGVVDPGLDAGAADGLVGVVAGGEELAVAVPGHPHGVLGELGAAPVPGARLGEEHLGADGDDLVADGGAADGGYRCRD